MSMYEVAQIITAGDAVALLPDGKMMRGRTFPIGALVELPDVESKSLVESGALRPAAPVADATPAELARAQAAHESASKRRAASDAKLAAALAELGRAKRALETDGEKGRPAVAEARRRVLHAEDDAELAASAEAGAKAALVDIERRRAMTEGRAALAEEGKRREKQAEAAVELVGHVREVKALLDRITVLNGAGDFAELRQRIQHEVATACQGMRVRPSDVGWIFR